MVDAAQPIDVGNQAFLDEDYPSALQVKSIQLGHLTYLPSPIPPLGHEGQAPVTLPIIPLIPSRYLVHIDQLQMLEASRGLYI